MKRRCSWCKKMLGVKCPHCGDPVFGVKILGFYLCVNPDCQIFIFEIDQRSETNGICGSCATQLVEPVVGAQ
jgi:hypothetical protein